MIRQTHGAWQCHTARQTLADRMQPSTTVSHVALVFACRSDTGTNGSELGSCPRAKRG